MNSRFFIRFFLSLLAIGSFPLAAQQIDDFYIPLPEAATLDFFDELNAATGTTLLTRTDIVIREPNTTVVKDSEADGYETQYTNPALWTGDAELWGDGDCTNGFRPDVACSSGAEDVFTVGDVLVLDQTEVQAGDYFKASNVVNLTRSFWPTTPGTVLAGAFELFPTEQWGTEYVVPVGENTPDAVNTDPGNFNGGTTGMFEVLGLTIMAAEDGTAVQIDPDGPTGGAALLNFTLNRGESVEVGIGGGALGTGLTINQGATVTSSSPVQVNVLTGDDNSQYAARFYTLFPNSLLSNQYFEATSSTSAGNGAAIFIYNPNTTQIVVDYFLNTDPLNAAGSLTIPANASGKYDIPTATAQGLTGVRLRSQGGENFTAYTVMDDAEDNVDAGWNHDWGHVTTPKRLMGDLIRVGFAPGRDPTSGSSQNASPIWLIADFPDADQTDNIQICVDAAGDGGPNTDPISGQTYDYVVTVQPLDSIRLYNNGPDGGSTNNNGGAQTGMLAFACDPVDGITALTPSEVKIAAAWGQDPARASVGSPGFDVGTTIRTGSDNALFIGDLIFVDTDGDGLQDVGEPGLPNVDVTITTPNPVVDVDPNTAGIQNTYTIQTDANGLYLFESLSRGEEYTITVTPPAGYVPVSDPDGLRDNTTTLLLEVSTLQQDFGYSNAVIGDFIYYDNDGSGTVTAGDTGIPGVEVELCYDVPPLNATDNFNTASYSNNLAQWNGNSWIETGDAGGATGGDILVTGGELQLSNAGTVTRTLDMSGINGLVTWSMDWRGGTGDFEATDLTLVQVNIGDGNGFVTLHTFIGGDDTAGANETVITSGGSNSGLSGSLNVTFNPQGSSNVQIRYNQSDHVGGSEDIFFDNVVVSFAGGTICETTVTDANGYYVFAGLLDEDYTVEVDPNGTTLPADVAQSGDPDGTLDNMSSVTVAGGTGSLDEDFGYITPSISGNVSDIQGNNLAGVTIQLYSDPNGDGDPSDGVVVATTTTDASGNYIFTGLAVGDYVVTEIDPAGYESFADADSTLPGDDQANLSQTDSLLPVSVAAGEQDTGNDFVDTQVGQISGRVWLDEDQDGVNDIEETGLTNVVVELQDGVCTPGSDCPTVLTDQYGNYVFSDLPPGDYDIVVVSGLPTNVTLTAGPFGVPTRSVTLAPGGEISNEDFGYIANPNTGIIGDRVWSDADGDGVQDSGEAGLAGVTLILLDANGTQVGATSTDADGDYFFTNVPFGEDYTVQITDTGGVLAGFSPTVGPQSEGGLSSNPVTLTPALTTVTDVDFGFDSADTLTISDRIWYDADGDQLEDAGEPGIAGVTVALLDGSGNVVATTLTDANGDFSFAGVPEGSDYTLMITDRNNVLAGLNETTTTGGDETISGSLDAAAGGDNLLDTVGDDGTATFGFNNPGSISGTVWSDANSNELLDAGEAGFGGITVTLTPPAGVDLGNGDGVAITTVTAPDGSYIFDGLPPGSYTIDVLSPPAGVHTEDPDSDDDNNATVVLGIGESAVDQDFGYFDAALNDISGTVFKDTDKDGVEEPDGNDGVNGNLDDEPGFPAVTLDLIDCGAGTCNDGDEAVIASTTTDANGDYSFPGLPDGDYQVAVTDTDGQVAGYDITSGLDVLPVTVAGADVVDVDFGYIKDEATGSIAGEVWIDEALINGLADDPETNLAGVTVYLCDAVNSPCTAGDALATTVTDANGEYVFNNLPSGQYVVDSDPATIPGGLDLTVDPAPVSLSEGENVTEVDIGYEPAANTGVLSGFVWTDVNSDGVYDPAEAPIGGVDIFVYSTTDNPGTLTLIATGTTEPNGRWMVSGISGSNLQDGLLITYDDADIPAGLESTQPTNLPLGDDLYSPVDLLSDEDNNISYLDFAFPPGVGTDLGSISGTIYSDTNQDADYVAADDGELRGVTVSLLDSGGNVILSTKTDENGFYIFDGLVDGTYSVVVSDSDNVLQDLNPLEVISNPIVLAGAANITDQDAGYISDPVLGSIGNLFFLDLDDNGIADLGEPGIQGVVVQCWVDTNFSATPNVPVAVSPTAPSELPEPGIDNLVRTVTTDENGEFYCTSLPTGQYIVRVFSSLDFNEVDDGAIVNVGTTAADDNNAKPWTYALTTESPNLRADFGIRGSNLISGTVFIEDETLVEPDGNGAIDPGVELDGVSGGPSADVPVRGVVVVLYRQNPDGTFSQVRRRRTNGSGDYQFRGLPDGTYRVEVLPNGSPIDGFGQTGDPDLAAVATNPEEFVCDSSTAALCDDQTQVVLAGSDATGLDFGYQKNFTTTPVTINAFSSEGNGGTVTFTWQTSNEVGHLGYQIYARDADAWVLLNDELIASPSSGDALQTRNYGYIAYGVEATWFALIDVSVNEELTVHGPYKLGESYGSDADEQPAFDWSSVARPGAASPAEQQRSVMDRVRRLRTLNTANDDEYEDAEELDALESSAHSGGQE